MSERSWHLVLKKWVFKTVSFVVDSNKLDILQLLPALAKLSSLILKVGRSLWGILSHGSGIKGFHQEELTLQNTKVLEIYFRVLNFNKK